ncbi:MAG: starch-binding protein, partial [Oscillospiraceae bacterium]|nr:starch-binding protein [Oscillospiraceae bacterium]
MLNRKLFRRSLSLILVLALLGSFFVPLAGAKEMPSVSEEPNSRPHSNQRGVHSSIIIDEDAAGGYEGDYVVIYNPATSSSTSYATGTMTGLIETSVNQNAVPQTKAQNERPSLIIDVDGAINERNRAADPNYGKIEEGIPTRATSYNVGDTKSFTISSYNPGSGSSLTFKVLAVGAHCYIWTPSQNETNYYTLDSIDPSYAQQAADEFDRMYSLMNSSFGNHSNGSNGDGKVSLLFYNIDDGWNGSGGFVAGYFSSASYYYDGMPIINIDTYPGVYYKTSSGNEGKSMDIAYGTACHEYQHCINYSNTSGMSTWLNECFSAAAEEICYPGSSVVSRIQSWENYQYGANNDWQNPPEEFAYQSSWTLHNGFSMYNWNNNLEMDDTLALYAQVSFFAQYLYTRFGNGIYKQISNKFSSSEPSAITSATGVSCADLVRDFRVAVTANAAQDQYGGIYGFREQDDYDPAQYHNVMNPYSLLSPVVFTGSSCSIKGGGAITVKPVNGVYNPPSGASSNLRYIGIKVNNYTVTAVSNNEAWGTVAVNGSVITASPADGYYVESCDVTEGTATCTINGNTISVSPSSDCTVLVNFAVKPQYTVNFVASGVAEGSQTALVQDVITLPSAVSVNPDGWTFTGWIGQQIDETDTMPEFYAPGADYTVTGNVTLYALYTRVEEGTGDLYYELLSAAPANWAGNYVISYNTASSSMYLMKGVTPSSNGARIESTSNASQYSASGASLADNKLTNVGDAYVFTLEPHGSYYSIRSKSTGCYLGMDSESYLSGYTTYTSGTCDWTPGNKDNAASATNATNGDYPLIAFNVNYNYFWSGNPNNSSALSVRWWKEANGSTTWYWTDPTGSAPEEDPVDVYFVDQDDNANAYVYAFGNGENAVFPGVQMTAVGVDEHGDNWYKVTVDRNTYTNVIFSGGDASTQTANLGL